jgi:hypothetical protein
MSQHSTLERKHQLTVTGRWEDEIVPVIQLNPVTARGLRSTSVLKATARPRRIENMDFFDGALLALGYGLDDRNVIQGTATMIAPGLILTAGHNLESPFPQADSRYDDALTMVFGFRKGGFIDFWPVNNVWRPGPRRGPKVGYHGEIAYLAVEPYERRPSVVSTLPLTTRIPRVGEEVTALGFRFADGDISRFEGLFASKGRVVTIKTNWLENTRKYPVLEIECETLHGMSGGPVLDEHGYIVGVVSRGYEDRSWVAMIGHGLGSGARLRITWPPGEYIGTPRITEIPNRLLQIQHRERILAEEGTSIFVAVEEGRSDIEQGPVPKPYRPGDL